MQDPLEKIRNRLSFDCMSNIFDYLYYFKIVLSSNEKFRPNLDTHFLIHYKCHFKRMKIKMTIKTVRAYITKQAQIQIKYLKDLHEKWREKPMTIVKYEKIYNILSKDAQVYAALCQDYNNRRYYKGYYCRIMNKNNIKFI